eukprot:123807_1
MLFQLQSFYLKTQCATMSMSGVAPSNLSYLVIGYIRSESDFQVPMVLVTLCKSYFGNSFHWNFYGKELNNFLTSTNGEVLYCQPFKINNIIFQLCIRPNQFDETQTGFIGLKLLLKSIDPNYKRKTKFNNNSEIVIDYELNCTQIESNDINLTYKDKFIHKPKNFHTQIYHANFMGFRHEPVVVTEYSFYDLMISQLKHNTQSLCFGCILKISNKKSQKKSKKKKIKTEN